MHLTRVFIAQFVLACAFPGAIQLKWWVVPTLQVLTASGVAAVDKFAYTDPSIVKCVDAQDCHDGVDCTVDTCEEDETGGLVCVNTPDDSFCDDGDVCTTDTCNVDPGGCVSLFEDNDGDGDENCIDPCPNDPDHGVGTDPDWCTDIRFRTIVLSEPSGRDAAQDEELLPMADPVHLENGCFVVEIWVQDTTTENHGVTCAFVDVVWGEDCTLTAIDIEYDDTFDQFRKGEIDNETLEINDLGACTLFPGIGAFPRWHLLATMHFTARQGNCKNTVGLADSYFWFCSLCCNIVCDPRILDYDESGVAITCKGDIYDLSLDGDDQGQITPGDFALLAACWMASGDLGECADVDWDCDGVVGPGDLNFFATAWGSDVCASGIVVPSCQLHCDDGSATKAVPWAGDETIRSFGLPVPPRSWVGWALAHDKKVWARRSSGK